MWNEDRTIRLPYCENARRAYKQLSLIEDSIVIYRLVISLFVMIPIVKKLLLRERVFQI